MSLWAQWQRFSRQVRIPSRDAGLILFRPYGTQTYLIQRIIGALEQGKREILVLKPRQVGISTAMLIWTLFWNLKHGGLQGAMITEADGTRDYLRGTLVKMAEELPPAWSYPILRNNRYGIQWGNHSRLVYEVAGKRKNSDLGKGKGLSYLHATELSVWGDEEGVDSLRAALSERHPAACYLWESTAQGFNFFYEMWQEFSRAVTLEAVFLAWWMHELYRKDATSREYEVYWDGVLTADERAWSAQVQRRYDVTITPEQWAWYRWKLAEKNRSQVTMHQNFPTLPEHAFQSTAGGFLDDATMWAYRERLQGQPVPTTWRYDFGQNIEDTELHETDPARAMLAIWERPRPDQYYVVACDPAFGAGTHGDSDLICIQVWRCERRQLVQCAEFVSREIPLTSAAWVLMHLAGWYNQRQGNLGLILEIQGPGRAVLQEVQRLLYYGYGSNAPGELQNVLAGIQHFIYRKPDSVSGGGGFLHWLTTGQTKLLMMEKLRDCILQNQLVIRSTACVEEIANLKRDGDKVEAPKGFHDDRAITTALAIQSWQQQMLPQLMMLPERPEGSDPTLPLVAEPGPPVHQEMVRSFFERLGVES